MRVAPKSRRTSAPSAARSRSPRWERKAGERPSALLEAALDAFAQHGFHATRLETIAEAAGVSKGTVYTYFENKEDLLRKAIEYRQEAHKAGFEAELGNFRGSAEEKLRFFLERLWAKALTEDWGRLHKLMHGEIADEAPELYRFWIRNGLLRGWKMVAGIMAEGQALGEFRAEADSEALARFLLSGLMNQAFLQVHMGIGKLDAFPLDRIYAAGVDTLLAGIRPALAGRARGAKHPGPTASRPSRRAVRRRPA
jgi:AcrR family transcriptional regulator